SPAGLIKSAWAYEGDKLVFDISVPVPARIELPDGTARSVDAGEYHYEILQELPVVRQEMR
ncbi:MAG: hypothetical protein J5967_05615, partial [Oscillospiraceae bacterium]|nr:hypothetical protein [Oscillospiraceae bacterium]